MDYLRIGGRPLNPSNREIRLIQLHPGAGDSPIECTISRLSLSGGQTQPALPPRFNALSYVWGNPNEKEPIFIAGEIFLVTTNLKSALWHLRSHAQFDACGLPLWVDAICINQDDREERNQQVAMMGDIYRLADRVIVWLGEGDKYSDWALKKFRDPEFGQQLESAADFTANSEMDSDLLLSRVVMEVNLNKRRWWSRVWVIQEVLLAKEDPIIACGLQSLPFSRYQYYEEKLPGYNSNNLNRRDNEKWAAAQEVVPRHPDGDPMTGDRPLTGLQASMWGDLRRMLEAMGVLYLPIILLSGFTHNYATDPRDYVYAFLGLISKEERACITVDYLKPPLEVFHQVFTLLWTSETAELIPLLWTRLSFCRPASHGIPSWVPDLAAQKTSSTLGHTGDFLKNDEPWRSLQHELSDDSRLVTLRGVVFGTIEEHHGFLSAGRDLDEGYLEILRKATLRALDIIQEAGGRSSPLHLTSNSDQMDDQKMRIIQTFTTYPNVELKGQDASILYKPDLWDAMLQQNAYSKTPSGISEKALVLILVLQNSLNHKLFNRRIFFTKDNLIGVGPGNLEVGDVVVYPFGMYNPLIVRPFSSSSPRRTEFTMVGPAYVDGLRDYAVLDKLLDQGLLQETDIHLK